MLLLWALLQAGLADRLAHDDIEVREQASMEARRLGRQAQAELERAVTFGDVDTASRARRDLLWIDLDERLSSTLKWAMPDLIRRLSTGDDREWTLAFFEARKFDRDGVELLATRALAGAPAKDKGAMLCAIGESVWHSLAPKVIPFLRDDDPAIRSAAAFTLSRLRAPGLISLIVPLLADDDGRVRGTAARILRALDARDEVLVFARGQAAKRRAGAPPLPSQEPRLDRDPCSSSLASELAELFAPRIAEVTPLLLEAFGAELCAFDSDFESHLAGAMRRGSPPPDLQPLFDHPAADIRSEAVALAGQMNMNECVPRLRTLLNDPDPTVVVAACRALSQIGAKEAAHEIFPLLHNRSCHVRVRALLTLEGFGADPRVETLLHDADLELRDWAREAIQARDRY